MQKSATLFQAELINIDAGNTFQHFGQRILYRPIQNRLLDTTTVGNGTISSYSAMITPTSSTLSAATTYTFVFVPTNYRLGMQIQLTVPSQIGLPARTLTCKGVYNFDNTSPTCTFSSATRKITITGGFGSSSTAPSNITFTLASLTNPTTSTTTDSFTLNTYNQLGDTLLDSISQYLTVSFNCTTPCKTCSSTSAKECTSCQGLSSNKYLFNNTCSSSCPSGYFFDDAYQCAACESPCSECSGSSTNCTACESGYSLSGSTCTNTEDQSQYSQYYFFASGMGVAVSFIVLVFKCCCCKTKWLESTIAWISISEIVAWAGLLYYYYYLETDLIHIITMAGACGMHVLLNIIYSLVHQKLVFKEGGALYKQLIMNYHCWNTLAIVIAFFFSFKFHIIQMSHFWNATALSGEWPKEVWGVWNMLCITYLISCYPILLGSSGYFAYKNMDKIDEWVFWGTIDVVALSTYVAFLLIISACCQGNKKSHQEIDQEHGEDNSLLNNRSQRDEDGSSSNRGKKRDPLGESQKNLLSDSEKRSNGPPPNQSIEPPPASLMRAPTKRGIEEKKLDELLKPKPGENLRTLPPPKPVEQQSMQEIKEAVRKMPLVNHVPPSRRGILRNQAQFGPPLPPPKSGRSHYNNESNRQSPTSDDMRKAAFPPANRKAPKPPMEKNPFPPTPEKPQKSSKQFDDEMGVMKQYIDFLKQEKQLMRDERQDMLRERQKILDQELLRQKEFMFMQQQMSHGHGMMGVMGSQRLELENMKLQFMMEMDRKLREHLGDLDVRSMRDKRSKRGGYRDDSSYDSEVESRRRGKGRRRDETPPKKDKRGAQSNPRGGKKDLESQYTYSYSPEVSLYDKGLQTDGGPMLQFGKNQKNPINQSMNKPLPKPNIPKADSFADKPNPLISKQSADIQELVTQPPISEKPKPVAQVPPPPPVKKGVEIIIQTDPIIPPKGPIYGNKPVKLHISKQSEKNEEGTATLDPIVQPLPGNGKIEKEGRLDTENFDMPEEEKVLDPISSRNNPLFKIQSEQMPTMKQSEQMSQLEPIQENHPLLRVVSGPFSQNISDQQSQMIANQGENRPFYSKGVPSREGEKELQMSQIEPIQSNNPEFKRDVSHMGPVDRSANDSMIEAIKSNNAIFLSVTPNSRMQNNLEASESLIEPFQNPAAVFNRATPNLQNPLDRSINESYLEPPSQSENKPVFKDVTPEKPLEAQAEDGLVLPITENQAVFDNQEEQKLEKDASEHMIEPIKENQPEFHEESTNPLELVKQDSQIEPLQENVPLTRQVTGNNIPRESSLKESMIEPIPQSEALKKDVSGRSIPREKERNESMMEAIEGNKPMISDASDRNLQRESSMRQSMVEPIGKSSALREDISGKSLPREEERHESMIEPITNEAIKKDASDKNLERQSELRQSMIEPIQNEPLSKDLSDKSLPKNIEMQEQMIEPVKGNSALQKKVSQKSLQKEVRDSIIEPIIQNQPLHQEVTEPTLEAQRQESLVEPLINNSPEFGRPSSNPTQQLYESQLEPIPKPQEQVFEKVTPSVTKSRQMNSSQMEPIPKHRPIYKDVSRSTFKEEQIEQMMQVEPVFEKLTPQDQSKEDIEIHPTEVPLRSDLSKRPIPEPEPEEEDLAFREEAQEQPVPMQVLSQQPIAKKIKKILYSDKSESSLDERMEDTPSNYNIPNGRLDGRSLGLKAIMLQEKKRGRKGPDVVKQPIQNDNLGKTLQPVSSGKLSSSKKSNLEATHQYFSPMRGTIQGPSQPSLLKNNGPDKVNNLFQDHSEVQIMTMNQPPQNSVFSRQGRVDSKGRQFQRRRIAPPSQEGDTGGHNSSLLNRKRAEALDLANQITHEYQPTFGAQDNDEDPDDNIYFMMDDNSKQTLPGGGTGTGMINGQKKKNTLPKGISKKQFKEEGSGNEAPNNNSPPPMMRNAPIDGINPYSIKTTLPDVGNKLPKLSFKQK